MISDKRKKILTSVKRSKSSKIVGSLKVKHGKETYDVLTINCEEFKEGEGWGECSKGINSGLFDQSIKSACNG